MKSFYIIILLAGLVPGVSLISGCKNSAATTETLKDSSLFCYNPDATNMVSNDQSGFKPTIIDSTLKMPAAIEDMVWISGGEFSMGAPDPVGMKEGGSENMHDARPVHRVHVNGFYMDATEVTNAQFRKFINATGYRTLAEIKPTKEEFPSMNEEDLKAGSIVFTPPAEPVAGADYHAWWSYVPGADWQHPLGPHSNIKGMDNLPVVHVSWPDAMAYAKWAGKRLPTEAEWEFAARGGRAGGLYTWGNELKPATGWAANIFQGHFPDYDKGEDGYKGIGRVKSYAPNTWGLYDMAGNVWEWCSDWYQPDYYTQLAGTVASNPKGPDAAVLSAQQEKRKIQRGGSFLCTSQYCTRYMVGSRGKGEWHTSSNHVGFRCVKDAD